MDERFMVMGDSSGKPVLLYHANAYMPELYLPFIEELAGRKIIAVRQRPLWDKKVQKLRDWDIFTKDLIEFCDSNDIKHIDAIGHSLGAVAIWKASVLRPDLFNKIILIDPVVLPKKLVNWVSIIPYKLKERIRPIIKIASLRRNHWKSKEEAREHLGSKGVFKKFTPQIFELFIEYGIVDDGNGGFTLAYPRDWEAMIYASPENTWKFMANTKKEILIIRAEFSNVLSEDSWTKMKSQNPINKYVLMKEVGHLIPFEKPSELAQIVDHFL